MQIKAVATVNSSLMAIIKVYQTVPMKMRHSCNLCNATMHAMQPWCHKVSHT